MKSVRKDSNQIYEKNVIWQLRFFKNKEKNLKIINWYLALKNPLVNWRNFR